MDALRDDQREDEGHGLALRAPDRERLAAACQGAVGIARAPTAAGVDIDRAIMPGSMPYIAVRSCARRVVQLASAFEHAAGLDEVAQELARHAADVGAP